MKKILILALCLLMMCAVLASLAGCGSKQEGTQKQDQGTERDQEVETSGKVEVPDVIGLTEKEAEKKLESCDLDCSTEDEDVTDKEKDGKVLSQDPKAGTMLTPDMTVYLTVGEYRD